MSGVGPSELLLLVVIGLLILGPERLPRVASQIGRWVGRARRTANQLRYQLEREIALADIEKKDKPDKQDKQDKQDKTDRKDEGRAGPVDDTGAAATSAGTGEPDSTIHSEAMESSAESPQAQDDADQERRTGTDPGSV